MLQIADVTPPAPVQAVSCWSISRTIIHLRRARADLSTWRQRFLPRHQHGLRVAAPKAEGGDGAAARSPRSQLHEGVGEEAGVGDVLVELVDVQVRGRNL